MIRETDLRGERVYQKHIYGAREKVDRAEVLLQCTVTRSFYFFHLDTPFPFFRFCQRDQMQDEIFKKNSHKKAKRVLI